MIKVINNLADLKSIEKSWHELAGPFLTPLLQYDWFSAAAEALCSPGELHILVNYSQSIITAIAPLALVNNRLELLGMSHLHEPSGFIYKDEDSLRELVDFLVVLKKPFFFGRLGPEMPEVSMLRKLQRGKTLISSDVGSPFLPIETSWERFEAGMTSNQRNELRRKRKSLETLGTVNIEIATPDTDNIENHLEEVVRVEAASWKGKEGTAMMFNEKVKRFFQIYSKEAARRGIVRICTLRVDDKAIAVTLALEYANRFWVLKVGYDEEWIHCAPGIVLLNETVKYAFEHNLEGYEFLGYEESWIHRWTKQVHPYVTTRDYPYTFRGLHRFAQDALESVSKKAVKIKDNLDAKINFKNLIPSR